MKKLILPILLMLSLQAIGQVPVGIDSSFGNMSHSLVTISTVTQISYAGHFITSDDKILLSGYVEGSNEDLFLAKLKKNGSADSAFGGGGGKTVVDPQLGADDRVLDMVELADGKILVTGSSNGNADQDIFVMRFNSDGSIDNTFQTNGYSLMNFAGNDVGEKITVYNNKIYIAARSMTGNNPTDGYIIRLNMDGTLDQSFGTMSFTIIDPFNGDKEILEDFTIMKDGSIVTIGRTTDLTTKQFACKMKANGLIDSSFGNNGFYILPEGSFTRFLSVADAGNGEVYISGYVETNSFDVATLWKLDATGKLSTSFGSGNGKASFNLGAQIDQQFMDLTVLEDGGAYLAGMYRFNGGTIKPLTVVYQPNGNINTNYFTNGYNIAMMPEGIAMMLYSSITKSKDSNMVVSGIGVDTGGAYHVIVHRYKKATPQSVRDIELQERITLYPNPSAGMVMLNTANAVVKTVVAYNTVGMKMAELTVVNNSINFPAHFANGIYYIGVHTDKGSVVKQVHLNR